jgi:hypothetical protein
VPLGLTGTQNGRFRGVFHSFVGIEGLAGARLGFPSTEVLPEGGFQPFSPRIFGVFRRPGHLPLPASLGYSSRP